MQQDGTALIGWRAEQDRPDPVFADQAVEVLKLALEPIVGFQPAAQPLHGSHRVVLQAPDKAQITAVVDVCGEGLVKLGVKGPDVLLKQLPEG